ncbi:hypothetical protein D3C83_60210 [compost metagenome]
MNQTNTSSQVDSSTAAILPGSPICRRCCVFNRATSFVTRTNIQPAATTMNTLATEVTKMRPSAVAACVARMRARSDRIKRNSSHRIRASTLAPLWRRSKG